MFSPGNLRATFDNPEYEKLISYWVGEKYTLRYTGGMVPDVFQVHSCCMPFISLVSLANHSTDRNTVSNTSSALT